MVRPNSPGPERMYEPHSAYITAYGQARTNHSQSGKELGASHNSVPNTPSGGGDSTYRGESSFARSEVVSAPITRTSSWPWITEGEGSTVDAVWNGGAGEESESENERGAALSLLKMELECVGRKEYVRGVVTATTEDYDVTDSDIHSDKDREIGDEEGEGEGEDSGDGTEDPDLEPTSPSVVSTKSNGKNGQSAQQLLNPKGAKKNSSKQKKKTQKK
jgi:hypothetical protein